MSEPTWHDYYDESDIAAAWSELQLSLSSEIPSLSDVRDAVTALVRSRAARHGGPETVIGEPLARQADVDRLAHNVEHRLSYLESVCLRPTLAYWAAVQGTNAADAARQAEETKRLQSEQRSSAE